MDNKSEKSNSKAERTRRRLARLECYRQKQFEELEERITRLEKLLKL